MASLGSASRPAFAAGVSASIHSLRRTDGSVVCELCSVAETPLARMKGLLGRAALAPHEGILIRPCGSIHTFFMRFALDAVFLARDGTILKIVPELKPWRMAGGRGARVVLELAAGEAARRGLAPGDRIDLPAAAQRSR